jgi:hypothetical protein
MSKFAYYNKFPSFDPAFSEEIRATWLRLFSLVMAMEEKQVKDEWLFQSDFGPMRIPAEIQARVAHVRRRKDGDWDYRFKAACEARAELDQLAEHQFMRDGAAPEQRAR